MGWGARSLWSAPRVSGGGWGTLRTPWLCIEGQVFLGLGMKGSPRPGEANSHKWARVQVPWEEEETLALGRGDQDPRGHFEALAYAQPPQHLVQ